MLKRNHFQRRWRILYSRSGSRHVRSQHPAKSLIQPFVFKTPLNHPSYGNKHLITMYEKQKFKFPYFDTSILQRGKRYVRTVSGILKVDFPIHQIWKKSTKVPQVILFQTWYELKTSFIVLVCIKQAAKEKTSSLVPKLFRFGIGMGVDGKYD